MKHLHPLRFSTRGQLFRILAILLFFTLSSALTSYAKEFNPENQDHSVLAATDDGFIYSESTEFWETNIDNLDFLSPETPPRQSLKYRRSYYAWGRAQNGWGYCYEYAHNGAVLNGGRPVANHLCERRSPSYYYWGRAQNGWGYCYQFTANGIPMNEGRSQANFYCERVAPSYYAWGRAQNGYTYCFQRTPNGYFLNEGRSVPNHYCR